MNDNKTKHEHCDNPECDCGSDEVATMTISLDDGSELECNVLGVFEVSGNEYIALLPTDDEEVLLYSYQEVDGEIEINEIDDDDLYDEVSDAFFSMINDEDDFLDEDDADYEYDDDNEDDDDDDDDDDDYDI